jgi:hypothetical protein
MKKTITVMTLLAGAVSAYSQGTINFSDYNAQYGQAVYAPSTGATVSVTYNGYTVMEVQGASAADKPSGGTTVYSGTPLSGTGFDAQVLAAPGENDTLLQLAPIGAPVFFGTSTTIPGRFVTAGQGYPTTTTTPSVPGSGVNGSVTVALAAWQNNGTAGAATTLAEAQSDGYEWGISALGNIAATGGGSITPPLLPAVAGSFSLGSVPEPSTIALGVLGASALLFRRRK